MVFFEGAAAEGAELGCRDLDLMRRVGGGGRSVTTSVWDTSGSGGPCGYTTVGYLDTNKVMNGKCYSTTQSQSVHYIAMTAK